MKVLDLRCEHGHAFEGWFGSEDDYRQQLERGLLECPLCGTKAVQRLPSAPRLNLSGARAAPAQAAAAAPATAASAQAAASATMPATADAQRQAAQAQWLQAVRHVMANTEDVGSQFAEEARRIHYGEAENRGIRGQASQEETQALSEEGIDVFSLPVPEALKGPLQ
ncbi:MAG: DUF1178 family protein [Leptothrix sp. (in: b-proteobacteria)]